MIRLRTIDVWDTLLRRRCYPDAVKLHLAGWLLAHHWQDVVVELRNPRALLAKRLHAERDAGQAASVDPAQDEEYAWRDVLERWMQSALGRTVIDESLIAALEVEEWSQERHVGYADPGIRDWLAKEPPMRTLFLSDFYMPAERIAALIDAHGLSSVVGKGVCSCDLYVNKRSGRLYQALHRLHGITPNEHLHVGDNRESDVRIPRRLGMSARHYRNRTETRLATHNRRAFNDRTHLARRVRAQALRSLEMPRHRDARRAFCFGIECAPLFVGLGLYLLEEAGRRRHQALFFLSREGAFLADIYTALSRGSASPGSTAPEARTLEISRRSSFAASLQEISIEEMQRLWRGHEPVTLRAWALSLDLDEARAEDWCRREDLPLDEALPSPATDPRVGRLLATPECHATLVLHRAERALLLRDYLAQQGVDASTGTAAVADIGWRGTIQDNLALLLPTVRFEGYYLGLQGFLNPQPANTVKRAYGPDLNQAPEHERWFRRLPLLELLCTPAQGGVLRYRRDGSQKVVPVRTEDEQHDSQLWRQAIAPFQAGVLQSVVLWAHAARVHAVDSSELRAGAMACWRQIIDRAPRVINHARAALVHDERFGRGRLARPIERRTSLFSLLH